MSSLRAQRGEGFVGHVLREAFLEPEVVEPAHGDEVAEPLVGQFVEDEASRCEAIVGGGRGAEEDGLFAEEGGAGVLHAAVGEAGDEDHVVFGKRKGLREVVGEKLDALARRWCWTAGTSDSADLALEARTQTLGMPGWG